MQEEYLDRAKVQLAQTHQHIQKMAEANKALHEAVRSGDIVAHGQASFSTAFVYGMLGCDLTFNDGTKLHFTGTHWGVGLGGGTSYGAGAFSVPPSQLIGSCSYEVHSGAVVAGQVTINWWRGSQLLGTFIGAALAVNLSITGGSGDWTNAQ